MYRVEIIGEIWQPGMGMCATTRSFLAATDTDALARVQSRAEFGDFSRVHDYCITGREGTDSFGKIVRDWEHEDSANVYVDAVYGSATADREQGNL